MEFLEEYSITKIFDSYSPNSNELHRAVNAFWTLKMCFFSSFFPKLDNVSSPIISQSLTVTDTLCQENVFKF